MFGAGIWAVKLNNPKINGQIKGDLKSTNKAVGKINDSVKSNIRTFTNAQRMQNEAI